MGRKTQIKCNGSEERFEEIARFVYDRFGNSIKYIADVARGQEMLSRILSKKYNYDVEVIDPRHYQIVGVKNRECYYKNKNGWRPVLEPFTYDITYGENDGYDIYYCNNTKDKVTGVFVTTFPSSEEPKKGLEITDKYKTEFNYITDDNNKPIKYFNKTNKIYFGVMNHNITDEYYIKINGKKIQLENK